MGWLLCQNGERLTGLVAALGRGRLLVAEPEGDLVRLPAGVWQMLTATIKDGLFAHRCSGCEIANGGELQHPHHDPLTNVEVAVLRLNHRQRLATGSPDAVIRSCHQVNDPIALRRPPLNEPQFAEFVAALGRWLYDGTDAVTSVLDRGVVKPTLPSWCYRDPRSVIVHVIALRNHYLHGLSPNETTAAEHLTSAGDVFQLYAGKRVPDDQDFAAIRVRMLAAAARLVDGLAAQVPVRDSMNAEAVFATRNGEGGEGLLPQVSNLGVEQDDMEDRRWPRDTRAA